MKEINIYSGMEGGVVIDGYLWFVATRINWICKMNLADYTTKYVCDIPFSKQKDHSYKIVAIDNGSLILMPEYAECILEYNIYTNTFIKKDLELSLDTSGLSGGAAIKFRSVAIDGDIVWMMPQSCRCIIEYNTRTHSMIEHNSWYKQFESYNWNDMNLFGMGVMVNDALWIPCYQLNAVLEFSVVDKTSKLHFIGNASNCYSAIIYTNKSFWLLDNINKLIIEWNVEKAELNNSSIFTDNYALDYNCRNNFENNKYGISCMYALNNSILLLPALANQFILFDTVDRKVKGIMDKPMGQSYVNAYLTTDDSILCFSQNGNVMVEISSSEKIEKIITFSIEIVREEVCSNSDFGDDEISFRDFFENIVNENKVNKHKKYNKSVGTVIYNKLINKN